MAHGGAIVQGLDGKEPGDLLAMLVDVLQQETIAPDAEPGVDAARSQRSLLGIEFAKWLLHSEEALFARMWHGTSQVTHTRTLNHHKNRKTKSLIEVWCLEGTVIGKHCLRRTLKREVKVLAVKAV